MRTALENAKALYLTGIRDGRPREAAERYLGKRYTQHSTGVKDGPEGFIEFFEAFVARNPDREIEIGAGVPGRPLRVPARRPAPQRRGVPLDHRRHSRGR